jgi:coenzyme F420 hydrogenase subunit beta
MSLDVKASRELQSEVLAQNLCSLCGACVGMCPYWVAYKGRVVGLDECNLTQGRCYVFCPRTSLDLDLLSQTLFGVPYAADELGTMQQITMARAGDDAIRQGQYGGRRHCPHLLRARAGLIDSRSSPPATTFSSWRHPGGQAAQVRDRAKSNYVAAPTLAAFNRESGREDIQRIGVVATPCQALALAKMRASPLENRNSIDKLKLVIGLFCTWALRYDDFARFLAEKVPLGQIVRFDIPPPPANVFQVFTDSQQSRHPGPGATVHQAGLRGLSRRMTGGVRRHLGGRRRRGRRLEHAHVRTDAGRELVRRPRPRE